MILKHFIILKPIMSSLLKYVEFDDINIIRENVKSSLDTLPLAQKLLYKYEFTSLIGLRTNDLANNMPPFIKIDTIKNNMDYRKVAIQELRERKLYYTLVRKHIGKNIYVSLSDPNLDFSAVEHLFET
jgi:DNA-directed RNA polymerase subunit K/omega